MNILLIDPAGALVDFGVRAIAEGHTVKQWIRPHADGSQSKIGRGLIDQVQNWRIHARWADLIILSDNAFEMREINKLHEDGYPILGTNALGAKLELDRDYGLDVMKKAGLNMMPSYEFHDYNSAIEFVKSNPKRYVSKPSGDADKALSYVSKSPADMVFMLERWKKTGKKRDFILQEFVSGIEVAVGGWISPAGFTDKICENFEHKKLMSGNYGCNTGEQGTVLRYVTESNLFNETLKRFEDYLVYVGHTGYVDLAFIIDDQGEPRPLEWTTRPGWPLFNIQQALHRGSVVDWMCDLLMGKDTLKVSKNIATGIVIPIGDYPRSKTTGRDHTGFPIYGLPMELSDDYALCEVMIGDAPQDIDGEIINRPSLVTAGDYVLVANGTGKTVKEACKKAYKNVKEIEIPDCINVRDDVGERLEYDIPELQSYGWCESWQYDEEVDG
jgi:phosphoribosylamine--glycine ligase